MLNKTEQLLNDIKSNIVELYTEFNSVKNGIIVDNYGDTNNFCVFDSLGLHQENRNSFPKFTNLLNRNSSCFVMSVCFLEMSKFYPSSQEIRWSDNYPVNRFWIKYIPGVDTQVEIVQSLKSASPSYDFEFTTSKIGISDNISHDIESSGTFLCVDIWDSESTPSDVQQTNYIANDLFYEVGSE